MPLTPSSGRASGEFFSRFLDTNGDGSGDRQATGNYAAAATDFFISPAVDTTLLIARMIVQIVATGNLVPADYGNLAALTNGILVLKLEGSTILRDYTDTLAVQTNGDWARTSYDVSFNLSGGIAENYIDDRWSMNKVSEGIPLAPGESFALRLNDDFSGLAGHTFCVQGELYE